VVDLNDPLNPRLVKRIGELRNPRSIAIQFRYGFVVDDDGLKVLDVSVPGSPELVRSVLVPLGHAHDVYVARTYAYVANGPEGIAIIDVERPTEPLLDQVYNADGKLDDVHQVKVAMTNASLFAYVADGKNGLRILQLTSPETMPEYAGFSPRPQPRLIATFKTKGEALAISKPLDRDRAVDESGNQLAVFGRRGARPFNLDEIMRLLRTNDGKGDWFTVSDTPPGISRR
jgi:LVIVD repeat